MSKNVETHPFKSEAKQVLDIVIHSLYSNKEIFLRELISNSSDALDKRRFEALTDKEKGAEGELEIRLDADPEARTLTVWDNGVGMSRAEAVQDLGTIARSGTREFVATLAEAKESASLEALIGQFGVGFYASFMVADEVSVITRRVGEQGATRWTSTGDGSFEVSDAERDEPGTTVTLKLKDADVDDGMADFTAEWTLKSIVKKYSDFVTYPIKLQTTRQRTQAGETRDDGGNGETAAGKAAAGKAAEGEAGEGKTTLVKTWETVNSMKAIWTRPSSEVLANEYNEFYKHISRDWNDPLHVITLKAEGTFEYSALLFLPAKPPFDLFQYEQPYGLQLYVNRVLIKDQAEELLPRYLRFVKGVVDSPDLSLNVSRELLQQDRHVSLIRKRVVRKVIDELAALQEEDGEKYRTFWSAFGKALKEGISTDRENKDRLKPLLLFASSRNESKLTTLTEYVARMEGDQEVIYYITGESRAAVERSPHLEAFREKEIEVLYLTDPVDEILVQVLGEFEGKKLQSVGKGAVDLSSEQDKAKAEKDREELDKAHASLYGAIQKALDDHVKEVRSSTRLTESPACLVGEEQDLSANLERLLKQAGQEVPDQKRILELNPKHPVLEKLQELYDANAEDPQIADFAHLLYGQALLAEGSSLPDPIAYGRRVLDLMMR
ncbi:MAG: molecular chaperone HtpG [bacterium]